MPKRYIPTGRPSGRPAQHASDLARHAARNEAQRRERLADIAHVHQSPLPENVAAPLIDPVVGLDIDAGFDFEGPLSPAAPTVSVANMYPSLHHPPALPPLPAGQTPSHPFYPSQTGPIHPDCPSQSANPSSVTFPNIGSGNGGDLTAYTGNGVLERLFSEPEAELTPSPRASSLRSFLAPSVSSRHMPQLPQQESPRPISRQTTVEPSPEPPFETVTPVSNIEAQELLEASASSELIRRFKGITACSGQRHATLADPDLHRDICHGPVAEVSQHCSDLATITHVLEGQSIAGHEHGDAEAATFSSHGPIPWVLDSGDIKISLEGLPDEGNHSRPGPYLVRNMQQAFEGTAAEDDSVPPPRLCMTQHYSTSTAAMNDISLSYDIDSLYGFAHTFKFAKRGLYWFADCYQQLNTSESVHLGLKVPPSAHHAEDAEWREAPLHHIPHYTLGQLQGFQDVFVWIFFPHLYQDIPASRRVPGVVNTLLSRRQSQQWIDEILLPSVYEAVMERDANGKWIPNSNLTATFPGSQLDARLRDRASKEQYKSKDERSTVTSRLGQDEVAGVADSGPSSGKMCTRYPLQAQHLGRFTDALDRRVNSSDAIPYHKEWFGGYTIAFGAKNTKGTFMSTMAPSDIGIVPGFLHADRKFRELWDVAVDSTVLNPREVYVDIARQITHRASALILPDPVSAYNPRPGEDANATVAHTFLWRNCCLESIEQRHHMWLWTCKRLLERFDDDQTSEGSSESSDIDSDQHIPEGRRGSRRQAQRRLERGYANPNDTEALAGTFHHAPLVKRPSYPPLRTFYPWANTGECGGMTLATQAAGLDRKAGIIYYQAYNTTKSRADAHKVYWFASPGLETLALDRGLLKARERVGGGMAASMEACIKAYKASKKRAQEALHCGSKRSYGTREEYRITLELYNRMCAAWSSTPTQPDDVDLEQSIIASDMDPGRPVRDVPLPFFAVTTEVITGFLAAQLNRHLALFESLYTCTGPMVSLGETVPMVLALRGLRYCYGSSLIQRDPVLFGDVWEAEWSVRDEGGEEDDDNGPARKRQKTRRRGLALYRSMVCHGFGWWRRGLFDWDILRFKEQYSSELMVGNSILRHAYRKRRGKVNAVQNTITRIHQVSQWFSAYKLNQPGDKYDLARTIWMQYLRVLCYAEYRSFVWAQVHEDHKKHPQLTDLAVQTYPTHRPPEFCWQAMKNLFIDRGAEKPDEPTFPHLVSGNHITTITPSQIVTRLLGLDRDLNRKGWENASFRLAIRSAHNVVSQALGPDEASDWYRTLKSQFLLYHWILPWNGPTGFFQSTKQQTSDPTMRRRLSWVSIVLANGPEMAQGTARRENLRFGAVIHADRTGRYGNYFGAGAPAIAVQQMYLQQLNEPNNPLGYIGEKRQEGIVFVCGIMIAPGAQAGRKIAVVEDGTPKTPAYMDVARRCTTLESAKKWFEETLKDLLG